MFELIIKGGLFMYPIVVVLALGVAIAIERYVYLSAARATNQRIWKQVMPLLMNGNYRQAVAVTERLRWRSGRQPKSVRESAEWRSERCSG